MLPKKTAMSSNRPALHTLPVNLSPDSQKAGFRPHLDIPHELRQVEVPLLPEAGELQEEAHSVVCLLQARQTLYRPHSVEALRGTQGRVG